MVRTLLCLGPGVEPKARGLSGGGAGAPVAPTRGGVAPRGGCRGGFQAQGRAPARGGLRLHRGALRRADLTQGRGQGGGTLGRTPHTVVGRKTGRTVLEWITERRMAEARKLLVGTDLPVEEVGRRVGYGDAGYFARTFGRAHGATPLGWRRAGRPTLLRGTARRVSLRSRRQRPLTSRTVSPVSCDAPYSARHGEQEILYGPVQRVMVLHRPSSRSDGAGTPQAPR